MLIMRYFTNNEVRGISIWKHIMQLCLTSLIFCMLSAVFPLQNYHSLTVRRVRTRQLERTLLEYRHLIKTPQSTGYTKRRWGLIFCNEPDYTLYGVYWLPPSSPFRHFVIPQRSLTFTPSEHPPRHFLSDAGGNQLCPSTWASLLLPNSTNTHN